MTPVLGQVFVTGMLRSGTSLLQTLLTNHPKLFVAYQPFNQLYVDVKQRFLDEAGIVRQLPLGDGINGPPDETERFRQWLRMTEFDDSDATRLVRRSVTGKGGSCAELAYTLPVVGRRFIEIHQGLHEALARHFGKPDVAWCGSKEILCEEFLPHLLEQGRRCVIVVRDPRAVIASANNGSYRSAVGDRYPILMLLRIWRKSVAYALELDGSPHFLAIRYEDLAQSTRATLDSIARFLSVEPFTESVLSRDRLLTHSGRVWLGNSSFGDKATIDKRSVMAWTQYLTQPEIDVIEALCYPEMLAMGYAPRSDIRDAASVIENFVENTDGLRPNYLNDYTLNGIERQRELLRLRILEEQGDDEGATNDLLQWKNAREKLSKAMHGMGTGSSLES